MDPVVIFYDEPTTGLDPASASHVQDLIQSTHWQGEAQGRTTVMITHDKDLLNRLRPRTIMLHDTRIYFDNRSNSSVRNSRTDQLFWFIGFLMKGW